MKLSVLVPACLLTFGSLTAVAQGSTTSTAVTATTDADILQAYAGTYNFADGSPVSTYSVTVKAGHLHGDAGMGDYKLVKQPKADQFQSTSSYGSVITFTRDAATKAVTGLTLSARGQELIATRAK